MTIFSDLDFLATRNAIEAELTDLLGTYLYPPSGASTAPAIVIDLSGDNPPKGTKVDLRDADGNEDLTKNGLEVSIRPQTGHSMQRLMGSNINTSWVVESEIIFKQWNRNQSVVEAVERTINCVELGLTVEMSPRVRRDETAGVIESQTITYQQRIYYRA